MPVVGIPPAANTVAVSLGDWIDEAMGLLYRANNRPAQLVLGSGGTGLQSALATDNTCTLSGNTQVVTVPTVLELGEELVLVTNVSADATPIITVSRGYSGSPIEAHEIGETVVVAPEWPRHEVRRHILRGINGPLTTVLPCVKTEVITPTVNQYYVFPPADCILPLGLAYVQTDLRGIVKRWEEITEWDFRSGVDPSVSPSGMIINVPPVLVSGNLSGFETVQTLYLNYQAPYSWSAGGQSPLVGTVGEVETLPWRTYAQDLPPLYAAAFALTGREIGRVQVDKVEYYNQEINFRQGVDLKIGMSIWQRLYQRIEECQKLDRSRDPKHRPYRRMRRSTAGAVGF